MMFVNDDKNKIIMLSWFLELLERGASLLEQFEQ